MGSLFHRNYFGHYQIDPYDDSGLPEIGSGYALEGDEITAEDRRLLKWFGGFSLFRYSADWLVSEQEGMQDFPPNWPWTWEKARTWDPVINHLISQREEDYAGMGMTYIPNMYELPAPRSTYFQYATAQAIKHAEDAARFNPLELPPLSIALTFTSVDFGMALPEELTLENYWSMISNRLRRLRIDERQQVKAEKIAAELGLEGVSAGGFWPFYIQADYQDCARFDRPFWHWAKAETYADETFAIIESSLQDSAGCPASFPSCIMHTRLFKPIIEVISSTRVIDTIVNEYTVELPPGTNGGFRLPYGAFTGPFLGPGGTILSYEGEPQISTNIDVGSTSTTIDDTTIEEKLATYYTFKVREYNFGPQINPLTGNLVGMLDRPYLFLEDEEGRASTHFTNDTDERRALFAQAEALAKQTLIDLWGFLPSWADAYGGTVDSYVAIHRGGLRDLPNYDRYFRQASADEKLRMQDWDYMLPYAFSIVVTANPTSTSTETNSEGSSSSSTNIETVEERDPITYTFTDTQEIITQKATLRIRYIEVPASYDSRSWLDKYTLGLGPHSFSFVDIAYRNEDQQLAYGDFWTHDEESYRFEIPPLPVELSYQLTKDLFTPDHTIMDYLSAIGPAEIEASKQAIQTYLGLLGGSTWLNQYGSAAPIFPSFKESLVLDTHLNKWGKLSQPHSLLVDLAPINSHKQRRVNPNTFSMQAAMLDSQGKVWMFNNQPTISELRYGKLGYHRLGFTDLEEMRLWFGRQSTGILQIEPSLTGDKPEGSLIKESAFDGTTSLVANYSLSARWYNVTLKGQYDVKGIEFIGRKSARR